MPEHSGMLHPSAKIRESISKHVWIKLTGPAAGSLTEAFCQNVAGLQENVSAKVVTLREAQKDDMTVPPTMIVMEGKAAGAQKYIKVEQLYRVVLLGNTEAEKSSLANAMFGEDVFQVNNTECQIESKSLHGRRITLINTPDFSGPGRSEEELKPEILRCVTECTPGPHAFLIVLKAEKSTEQQQKAVIEKINQYFSEEVFKYAAVVFTQDDPDSDEMKIKQFIDQNKYLNDLMRKCKSRYHIINKYNGQGDSSQFKVVDLLNTVGQVVKENKGVCYTSKMLPQADTRNKANSSVSKNEMIKLAGAAAESMAKAFSGSTVVVLTPGSTNAIEKDGTATDEKEGENVEGKATSKRTNNGQKEMSKEEGGGRKNEKHATSEKMNDEQTEVTKDEEAAAGGGKNEEDSTMNDEHTEMTKEGEEEEEEEEGGGGRKNEEHVTLEKMNDEQTEMTKEENGEIAKEKEERKNEGEVAKETKEAQERKTTGKSNEQEQDEGPNKTQEEIEEAGKKLQEDTQEKTEGKREDKPHKKVQESAGENKLGGGASAGARGVVTAGVLLTAASGAAAGAVSTAIGGGVAAGTGTGASTGTAGAGGAAGTGGAAGAVEATRAGASAGTAGAGGTAAGYVAAAAAAAVVTGGAVGVAWLIQKIRNVIELIKQHLGVVLLVLVFYSLLLSWFFLKAPFAGTLLLSFLFLLLVIILVII
uniref:AIG1-type G domain-containing protein n=1 Tax=Astatotilapia calliptera TaxID=8154 RepID=A0AAX7U511_ASTCA